MIFILQGHLNTVSRGNLGTTDNFQLKTISCFKFAPPNPNVIPVYSIKRKPDFEN